MKKKKGSLNLSINAIVVLILAITMLGLGLGFMKKTFGGVSEQFEGVSDEMKKEMIDRMEDSTSSVELNVAEVSLKPNSKKKIYLAIKDSATDASTSANYTVTTIKCVDSAGTAIADTVLKVNTYSTVPVMGRTTEVTPITIESKGTAKEGRCMVEVKKGTGATATDHGTTYFYVTIG